jgi:hypothetical protein
MSVSIAFGTIPHILPNSKSHGSSTSSPPSPTIEPTRPNVSLVLVLDLSTPFAAVVSAVGTPVALVLRRVLPVAVVLVLLLVAVAAAVVVMLLLLLLSLMMVAAAACRLAPPPLLTPSLLVLEATWPWLDTSTIC